MLDGWHWYAVAIATLLVFIIARVIVRWRAQRGTTLYTLDVAGHVVDDQRQAPGPVSMASAPHIGVQPARRLRCECCGYLTLTVPMAQYADDTLDAVDPACPFCDWENPPLNDDGTPKPNPPSPEERNDGHSLSEARANVGKFLWMYDPAHLEPWMTGPPSSEEMAIRRQLRDAYEAVERNADDDNAWSDVVAGELALRHACDDRVHAAEDAAEAEGVTDDGEPDDDEPDEPDEPRDAST